MLPTRRRPALTSRRSVFFVALTALGIGAHQGNAAEPANPPRKGQSALQLSSTAPAASVAGNVAANVAAGPAVKQASTRFVIGLERRAEFQVFSMNNPNRVIVELPDIKMQLPLIAGDQPVGLVKSFRGGQSAPGKARVVIDVTTPVVVEKAVIENGTDGRPTRLVIDIAAASDAAAPAVGQQASAQAKFMRAGATGLGAIGLLPPAPKAAMRSAANSLNVYKPVIVIDPGHGGHDSGAKKFGTVEKEVVLAFSLLLRDKLVASGRYRVMMTRDNDTFVDLDDRREFAEKNKAALFIAIHADYAGQTARGATIYSLRESVAESLKRSARGSIRERVLSGKDATPVKADVSSSEPGVVNGFLADLAQREVDANKDRTNIFTQSVIETMGQSTHLQNNPDRSAAFRVLKTAQVPAVLIELAYVTNQQDAKNLRSDEWRGKVSASIMTAIDNYFSDPGTRTPM